MSVRKAIKHRIKQNLSLLTRWWNIWRHGGYASITTSARAFREAWLGEDRKKWAARRDRIDAVLDGEDGVPHCEYVWRGEVARAWRIIDDDGRIKELRAFEESEK